MYNPSFTNPDIKIEGQDLGVNNLSNTIIHLLAQRAPTILYGLSTGRREDFLSYLEGFKISSPVNALLKAIVKQNTLQEDGTVIKIQQINLIDLLGENAVKSITLPKRGGLGKMQLIAQLQQMFFSEKSSFAQSGIFASCTVEGSDKSVYNSTEELLKARINLVVSLTVDTNEHPFLLEIIKKFRGEVGRLLAAPRQIIRLNENGNERKIGLHEDLGLNQDLEVVLGDETQRYPSPKIDANSGAIIIPLCPSHTKYNGEWVEANSIKYYAIEEPVVQAVVDGGSRKALSKRNVGTISQTDTLKPGETRIMEIPIDIGPYDADIEVVCVDGDGKTLNIIHFPATYLDAVRTFADGENRMQVEIKNMGSDPVKFKDIHFRIKLFETDKKTHEKFRLRRRIQEAEMKGFYAVEHLVYTEVLHGGGEGDLSRHTAGLGELSNLDNLFQGEHAGLIFFQEEKDGIKKDTCEVIQIVGDVSDNGTPPLQLNAGKSIVSTELNEGRDGPRGYQKDYVTIMKNACSVGREKKVIFTCRSDINLDDLEYIVKERRVTDIFCIPGHNGAISPETEIIEFCRENNIKLASIEITSDVADQDIQYDLVGKQRK